MLDELLRLQHKTVIVVIVICAMAHFHRETQAPELSHEFGAIPGEIIAAWKVVTTEGWDTSAVGVLLTTVSYCFLHGDVPHLAGNMLMLWPFGCLVSQHLGKWWFVAVFIVTGICACLAHIAMQGPVSNALVGASGAVCGMEGVYLGLALRWPLRWPDIWPIAHPIPPVNLGIYACIGVGFDIYNLMQSDRYGGGIAFAAHVGGFISGLIIAAIITQLFPNEAAWQRRRADS